VRRTQVLVWIAALVLALLPLGLTAAVPRCYPTNRFIVLTGGMVQDALTGLMWQQDGGGTRQGCSATGNLWCTWAEAKDYCSGLALGDFSDWRLPTVRELLSIVSSVAYRGTTINQTAFPDASGGSFWTSSPSASSSDLAWYVALGNGRASTSGVGNYYSVRCVR
jgi:hypothetical protein